MRVEDRTWTVPIDGDLLKKEETGGIFVCSGIIRDREEDVRRALLQNNYEIIDTRHRGEWVAFAARR